MRMKRRYSKRAELYSGLEVDVYLGSLCMKIVMGEFRFRIII